MKRNDFKNLLFSLDLLTQNQREKLLDKITDVPTLDSIVLKKRKTVAALTAIRRHFHAGGSHIINNVINVNHAQEHLIH
jgi:hypothetical protein